MGHSPPPKYTEWWDIPSPIGKHISLFNNQLRDENSFQGLQIGHPKNFPLIKSSLSIVINTHPTPLFHPIILQTTEVNFRGSSLLPPFQFIFSIKPEPPLSHIISKQNQIMFFR